VLGRDDVLDPIRSMGYLRVRQERQRALHSYRNAARFDAEELARIQAAGVAGAGAAAGALPPPRALIRREVVRPTGADTTTL
jgi:hypothetical protein